MTNSNRARMPFWFAVFLPATIAACAATPSPSTLVSDTNASKRAAEEASGMAAIPACADGLTATLQNGLHVRFQGSSPEDAATCVQSWGAPLAHRQQHQYYLSLWRKRRLRPESPQQRQAIANVLASPVGTSVRFALSDDPHRAFFGSATLKHIGNETLTVGTKPRSALKLSLVLHDAHDRPEVFAENLYWLDRETGIPLKKEVVTHTTDGGSWTTTVWRVESLVRESTDVPTAG